MGISKNMFNDNNESRYLASHEHVKEVVIRQMSAMSSRTCSLSCSCGGQSLQHCAVSEPRQGRQRRPLLIHATALHACYQLQQLIWLLLTTNSSCCCSYAHNS